MQPARVAGFTWEKVEEEGREVRAAYLYREVMQVRASGKVSPLRGKARAVVAPKDGPWLANQPDDVVTRAHLAFEIATKFKLDVRGTRCVWEALDAALDDERAGYHLSSLLCRPRMVKLWMSPSGEIHLTIPVGSRTPDDLTTTINRFRARLDQYPKANGLAFQPTSDTCLEVDSLSERDRTHRLWLRYGPDRQLLADMLFKERKSIDKDLERHDVEWQRNHGGRDVSVLWNAISTFHHPIAADTDKINLVLTV